MPENIIPVLRVRDPAAAIRFLVEAFGFRDHEVTRGKDGAIEHAELRIGDAFVMLGPVKPGGPVRAAPGGACLYVVVDDPDAHCARARAAGASITMELVDQPYGSREYGARDLDGNEWYFGTYRPG